jgi:hypothetical protein
MSDMPSPHLSAGLREAAVPLALSLPCSASPPRTSPVRPTPSMCPRGHPVVPAMRDARALRARTPPTALSSDLAL